MRRDLPWAEGEADRLAQGEIAVVEAGVALAASIERLAAVLGAYEWGEGTLLECQTAKRGYVRAKVAFRLALVKLRQQGQS